MYEYDLRKSLDSDLFERMTRAVCEQIEEAQSGASNRNERLEAYAEMLEGEGNITFNAPWQDASTLRDPLTLEQFISLLASLMQEMRQPPYWLVEAVNSGDEQRAMNIEWWLSVKAHQAGLPAALYAINSNALRDDYAVLNLSWQTKISKQRTRLYQGPDNAFYPQEQLDPDIEYTPQLFTKQTVVSGPSFRAVECADFFIFPPNARSIEEALGVGERMMLTASELLAGIKTMGLYEDEVRELIARGPTHGADPSEWHRQRDERQGINSDMREGVFEIFVWYGELPILLDESRSDIVTPEEYWGDDIMWVICPMHRSVLKMDFNPEAFRPYENYSLLPLPNAVGGRGLVEILLPLQDAADANIQFAQNSANMMASPMVKVPMSHMKHYRKSKVTPGGLMGYFNHPNEVQPFTWDMGPLQYIFQLFGISQSRARELVSGQGYGQLPDKVRKAAEVQAAIAGVDSKFQFYRDNLQMPSERLATKLISMYMSRMGPEGETVRGGGRAVTVTPDDLRAEYRFVAHANSDASNPRLRQEKISELVNSLRASPLWQAAIAQGDLSLEYHAMSRYVEVSGERNVQSWIGQEPPSPVQPEMPGAGAMPGEGMAGGGMPMQEATMPQMPPADQMMGQGGMGGGQANTNGLGVY